MREKDQDVGGDDRPQGAQEPSPVAGDSASHAACHDLVCNGDRRYPRGEKGTGCSCRGRGAVRAEINDMVTVLKAACDRSWSDETPLHVATIAANGIYWRNRELTALKSRRDLGRKDFSRRWQHRCESIAQATPREWGALDQRYFDAGSDLIDRIFEVFGTAPEAPSAAPKDTA